MITRLKRMPTLGSSLKRFCEISGQERLLVLRAVLVVATVSIALFAAGTRLAKHAGLLAARGTPTSPVERIAWAVAGVGACIPGTTCLIRAIALQAMLARTGHSCRVEIGVIKDPEFRAHAWVVAGDRIVLGGPDIKQYGPIATLD